MPTPANSDAMRPEATTEMVEDLVRRAKEGRIRIPAFQRKLKWDKEDVIDLFDSIYKGYPIGSLLLQRGKAPAKQFTLGPLQIDAPERTEALWVVDGQQRLTALAASLARVTPVPTTPIDPYVIYFDADSKTESKKFFAPPTSGIIPTTWVPVAQMLDAATLSEWVFNWPHMQDTALRQAVFDAGARIRQYKVLLYTIETEDQDIAKDIFYRTNNAGKPLKWAEVYDALFGHPTAQPSTLGALADELALLGMGRPDERQLLPCLLAYQGLDATRNVAEHQRKGTNELQGIDDGVLTVLRSVLSFLRHEAGIPHLRLLPQAAPLVVLSRFFRLFPEPNDRTMQLLTRWTWRVLLRNPQITERAILRQGVAILKTGNAEDNALQLLKLIPNTIPVDLEYRLPSRFNARTAENRLAMLGLVSLYPLVGPAQPVLDIPHLIELFDLEAFRTIIPVNSRGRHNIPLIQSPANRILLPGTGSAKQELLALEYTDNEAFFASHGINFSTWKYLVSGEVDKFLQERHTILEEATRAMGNYLAAWGQRDRPSIAHLLALAATD
jgi:hypothetical protein